MVWTTIVNSRIDSDSPVDTALMTNIVDNFEAIAHGLLGAPRLYFGYLTSSILITSDTTFTVPDNVFVLDVDFSGGGGGGTNGRTGTTVNIGQSGTSTTFDGIVAVGGVAGSIIEGGADSTSTFTQGTQPSYPASPAPPTPLEPTPNFASIANVGPTVEGVTDSGNFPARGGGQFGSSQAGVDATFGGGGYGVTRATYSDDVDPPAAPDEFRGTGGSSGGRIQIRRYAVIPNQQIVITIGTGGAAGQGSSSGAAGLPTAGGAGYVAIRW